MANYPSLKKSGGAVGGIIPRKYALVGRRKGREELGGYQRRLS